MKDLSGFYAVLLCCCTAMIIAVLYYPSGPENVDDEAILRWMDTQGTTHWGHFVDSLLVVTVTDTTWTRDSITGIRNRAVGSQWNCADCGRKFITFNRDNQQYRRAK